MCGAKFDVLLLLQSEQKRFLQQHKQRSETYSKAAAMMKKQRKKSRGSTKTGLAMDKELKVRNSSLVLLEFVVLCTLFFPFDFSGRYTE